MDTRQEYLLSNYHNYSIVLKLNPTIHVKCEAGETAQSTEPPKAFCNSQETGKLCDSKTCFACNSIREAQAQTVRGTLLVMFTAFL